MSDSKPTIQDIIFIGSGISTSFSLIKLMKLIEKKSIPEKLFISIIEKNGEFHTGIPYGSRSGFSALLITSLRNFLPQPQLADFILWLNDNKNWLLKEFEKEGGERSKVWLETHAMELKNNDWEDLFIPRRFFGCYMEQKVTQEIERLEGKNLIKVSYISSEVVDTEEHSDYWRILLKNNSVLQTKKVVLAIGSLPTKSLWKKSALIEKDNLLFINKPYQKSLPQTLKTIKEFTEKRTAKNTNLIIIGANASGLELLYKIHDYNLAIDSFTILSTKGILPDAEIDKEKLQTYRPKFLWQLKEETTLDAEQIAEATFKDLNEAEKIQLGAASTVGLISSAFGSLLSKLSSEELKNFACFYGNEIGRRQRCAGIQYSNTIEVLKSQNKFNLIAGKFNTIHETSSGDYTVEYLDTATQKNKIVDHPSNIVINCIGGMNFTDQELPNFLKNLINKKIITTNASKIGIDVNDNLESTRNFHVNGPLLAGNVIEDEAVWHVEHCGRIIKFSELLANKLLSSDYSFRVLYLDKPQDLKKYNALLSKFYDNNPYYCYSYFCHHQNSTNKLIAFELRNSANSLAIMPIILRSIKNSSSFDVISPYGYSGPLFIETINPKTKKVFWEFVDRWYLENNVISEFIRFDLKGNNEAYSGKICETLDNVYGALAPNFEGQWDNFSSKVRNNYRKALNYALDFKIYENKEITEHEILSFYTIYLSTMKRNSAPEFLFFSENYFKNLILNSPAHYTIALTTYKGIPVSAELIINHQDYLHAFLGGTDSAYFNLRPNDFLRVEVIKWAIKKGKKTYILGGGICNGDGLYKSKKALFPKSADRIFYTGRKIINLTTYQQLVQENSVVTSNSTASDFFPEYRKPN
ncbi:GNAT family N-acetyltransferase [Cellulophaga sp. Hel_I_12]|uniref:GNAT family N-acetyltransferase n=1 Tax=Cellulophaga sp. Hel_I_12 TaxID=1249972 RepID=UPI0009DCAD91|nr:GNAT family N-acetyltransferase [Cellulophaga sp. Hel_I_12]